MFWSWFCQSYIGLFYLWESCLCHADIGEQDQTEAGTQKQRSAKCSFFSPNSALPSHLWVFPPFTKTWHWGVGRLTFNGYLVLLLILMVGKEWVPHLIKPLYLVCNQLVWLAGFSLVHFSYHYPAMFLKYHSHHVCSTPDLFKNCFYCLFIYLISLGLGCSRWDFLTESCGIFSFSA